MSLSKTEFKKLQQEAEGVRKHAMCTFGSLHLFLVEKTASTKDLKWGRVWGIQEIARQPVGLKEMSERESDGVWPSRSQILSLVSEYTQRNNSFNLRNCYHS